ncbi:MAG: mechanosensitive ion channel [Cyanobacteria bacterium M_surface_10_m2_179]|nr:mechanosensitive ion channel [Cyanobacteria bacterium M_surface_10_m2_179]
MRELLLECQGWLAYLERPSVLIQLLLAIIPVAVSRRARQRRLIKHWPAEAYPFLGIILLTLAVLGLASVGHSFGLTLLLGLFWLGWFSLHLLHRLLLIWLPEEPTHQLESRLLRPAFLVAASIILVSEVDSIQDLAVAPLGELFGISINAGKLFEALVVIYLVLVGCGPPAAGLAWIAQRALGLRDGSRKAMELILRYTVVGIGLVIVAVQLGLNTNALIAVAGGLSVGLGFGIKEVFSNFVSGLWLLFEGSVRPGEVLLLDGDPCEVRRLGLRATLLWRDRDNAELLVPNQTFFTEATTTFTASDRMRRSQVSVGAAYHHNPSDVIALLENTALSVSRVLPHPAPKALLVNYGDSAINYALRFWIANPLDNSSISSEVSQAIWHAFKQQDIEIPFPQQVEYSMVWPPEKHQSNNGRT